jgi:[ribosomal protein S5]-alanine N-acetyltransferase
MVIPTLITERLRLAPLSSACESAYVAFYTDESASKTYGGPLTHAGALARLTSDREAWHRQGFGVWAIELTERGGVLGVCGFWQGPGWPRELTWWLLPHARGRGYALEASRAAVAHAYRVFGWEAVQTYMNDENEPARGLALRLEGKTTGRQAFPDGLERDVYLIPPPVTI